MKLNAVFWCVMAALLCLCYLGVFIAQAVVGIITPTEVLPFAGIALFWIAMAVVAWRLR